MLPTHNSIIEHALGYSNFMEKKCSNNYDFSLLGKRGNSIFSNGFKENPEEFVEKGVEVEDTSYEYSGNRERRSKQKFSEEATKYYGRNKGAKNDKKRKNSKAHTDLSLEKKKSDCSKKNFPENQNQAS